MTGPVVCAFEDGGSSRQVVQAAGWLAGALGSDVVLCHGFDEGDLPALPARDPLERVELQAEHAAQERLRIEVAMGEAVEALRPVRATIELLDGPPDVVATFAREVHARLLVVGTVARAGMDRLLKGSVGARLVEQASCPSLVVPPEVVVEHPGPVVVDVDGSDEGWRAVRHAAELARTLDRDLVLVAEPDPGAALRAITELPAHLRREGGGGGGRSVEVALVPGGDDRAERLTAIAVERSACLLLFSARAHGDLRTALFGSFSLTVMRSTPCPVVLVPATPAPGGPTG